MYKNVYVRRAGTSVGIVGDPALQGWTWCESKGNLSFSQHKGFSKGCSYWQPKLVPEWRPMSSIILALSTRVYKHNRSNCINDHILIRVTATLFYFNRRLSWASPCHRISWGSDRWSAITSVDLKKYYFHSNNIAMYALQSFCLMLTLKECDLECHENIVWSKKFHELTKHSHSVMMCISLADAVAEHLND